MKNIKIMLILLAVMAILSCSKEEVIAQKESITEVKTMQVMESSYIPQLSFSGSIAAFQEANLGTALPGRVEKVYYAAGDKVEKGALIAELSDELLQQAEIEYKAYEKDFRRMERLREKGSVPEIDYDHIKAEYEAKLENYEMIRKNTQIKAPFAGTIIDYIVQEGENYLFSLSFEPGYSTTSGVVRLMALDKVKVKFDAGSSDIANIKPGLKASVKVSAYPDLTFEGEIIHCEPYLNQLTRTMGVTVELDNDKGLLKPGMFAEVAVSLPVKNAILVPMSAVQRIAGTGEDVVYLVKSETVERRSVQRQETISDDVAISGIEAGEQLIVSGKSKVKSGQKVKSVNWEE